MEQLSVLWGVKGDIRWDIFPNGCTITADLNCQQLDWVAEKRKGKQDWIYFFLRQPEIPYYEGVERQILEWSD